MALSFTTAVLGDDLFRVHISKYASIGFLNRARKVILLNHSAKSLSAVIIKHHNLLRIRGKYFLNSGDRKSKY